MPEHDDYADLPTITSLSNLPTPKLAMKRVPCPEIGGNIPIWELTGEESTKWSLGNRTMKRGQVVKTHADTATARLLQLAMKTEQGEPQYSLREVINFCKRNPASMIARLERMAMELSGLDGEDDDDAEGLDDDEDGSGND